MESSATVSIYEQLGVRPVINARGLNTVVGGGTPSPRMKEAMERMDRYYVDMRDLLEKSGQIIARLLGCEAAYVTPGAAAALTLGTAACITGDDVDKMARLPDTEGLKNKVVIQANQTYQYDRSVTIVGTTLVEVGGQSGTTAQQLESAMTADVACVLYPAHLDQVPGALPLDKVLEIAHAKGVPVLVDAAAQVYPIERMLSFPRMGADLVAYSVKYIGGPNSSGILCGKKALIDAAVPQGFIGFETVTNRKGYGRPFKLDRQEIVGAMVCLQEWLETDHERRAADLERRIAGWTRQLEGLPGLTLELLKRPGSAPRVLRLSVDAGAAKRSADDLFEGLRAGKPAIFCNRDQSGALLLNPGPVHERDVDLVGQRLRALLS
jgi:D-glucosaminate-6-phosphate ammonia-lyase